MIKKKIKEESDILAEVVVKGMQEKKAADIVVIDLKSMKNAVSDYFVISSANWINLNLSTCNNYTGTSKCVISG